MFTPQPPVDRGLKSTSSPTLLLGEEKGELHNVEKCVLRSCSFGMCTPQIIIFVIANEVKQSREVGMLDILSIGEVLHDGESEIATAPLRGSSR